MFILFFLILFVIGMLLFVVFMDGILLLNVLWFLGDDVFFSSFFNFVYVKYSTTASVAFVVLMMVIFIFIVVFVLLFC